MMKTLKEQEQEQEQAYKLDAPANEFWPVCEPRIHSPARRAYICYLATQEATECYQYGCRCQKESAWN